MQETLNARSEYTNSQDDGVAQHRINQYLIQQEIGRGSFGAVHLAADQYGNEYAVKEFSKSRLRRRAQSNILRRPHPARRGRLSLHSPLQKQGSGLQEQEETQNPLYLIKEEIAIMKKLNHPNLVSLIEVLDDPEEDSLYMVLEMCKKGVIMKVGLEEKADPYDEENSRCWFRDLILGIEYLHAQGILHRDIKPDNLLLTEDDVLKIVDFGVSEMFEKQSEMKTEKSAGSPAFLPPELCVAKHGGISGKAADIWSMGVTLYCLLYGRIPFEKSSVLDLYESIKNDPVDYGDNCDPVLKDLLSRLLEKDPAKRITMPELREHPWVTKGGTDPLLSAEENTADLVEPPTEEEMNSAITGNMSKLLVVMKAVTKFKNLVTKKRPDLLSGFLGRETRIVQPPLSISSPDPRIGLHKSKSMNLFDRRSLEQELTRGGLHREVDMSTFVENALHKGDSEGGAPDQQATNAASTPQQTDGGGDKKTTDTASGPSPIATAVLAAAGGSRPSSALGGRGHAHDPREDSILLHVGLGGDDACGDDDHMTDTQVVSESPPATDINIYETAYREEIERIRQAQGSRAMYYLTRRVENHSPGGEAGGEGEEEQNENEKEGGRQSGGPLGGFAQVLEKVRHKKGVDWGELDGGDEDEEEGNDKE
ncbi:MAG: hypothetical protein M1819_007176 [Sarea resinae]|nr:MAG: hypothetical protein M1819_007176 [Sarea resinae]